MEFIFTPRCYGAATENPSSSPAKSLRLSVSNSATPALRAARACIQSLRLQQSRGANGHRLRAIVRRLGAVSRLEPPSIRQDECCRRVAPLPRSPLWGGITHHCPAGPGCLPLISYLLYPIRKAGYQVRRETSHRGRPVWRGEELAEFLLRVRHGSLMPPRRLDVHTGVRFEHRIMGNGGIWAFSVARHQLVPL